MKEKDHPTPSASHKASDAFEKLYAKEKHKSRALIIISAVLAVLLVGSVTYNFYALRRPATMPGQLGAGSPPQFGNGGGRFGMGMRGADIKSFFKSDGSVDTDRVKQLLDRLPEEAKSQFQDRINQRIDAAVSSGEITSDQANALKSAFGNSGSANGV